MKRLDLVVMSLLLSTSIAAQTLDDKAIEQVITLGRANAYNKIVWRCTAKRDPGSLGAFGVTGAIISASVNASRASYDVTMAGPRGRIAVAAWHAQKDGRTFTRADVQPEWLMPALFVLVEPNLPDPRTEQSPVVPAALTKTVFREFPGKRTLLEPQGQAQTTPRTWTNNAGATLDYVQLWLRFDAAMVKDLYAPEMQFAVYTDDGERVCGSVPMRTVRNTMNPK